MLPMHGPLVQGCPHSVSVPRQPAPCDALLTDQTSYNTLCWFVQEASSRGIVAGIQATLLKDLAAELCRAHGALTAAPSAPAAAVQAAAGLQFPAKAEPCAAATTVPEQQLAATALVTASSVDDAACAAVPQQNPQHQQQPFAGLVSSSNSDVDTWSFTQQPQLQIKPLDLHSGALPVTTGSDNCSSCALQDTANALSRHAASIMDFGLPQSLLLAAAQSKPAAVAAAQPQQQPSGSTALQAALQGQQHHQEQNGLGIGNNNGFALFAGSSAAVATAPQSSIDLAATAATATAGPASQSQSAKLSSSRKHRFTKEQQQAILESVERNYALYPSRYTELVIKQMQERFPGIEINNACVRKIKFRATEAHRQSSEASRRESLAAADAAQGLVGLAAAAAAGTSSAAGAEPTGSAAAAAAGAASDMDAADFDSDDLALSRGASLTGAGMYGKQLEQQQEQQQTCTAAQQQPQQQQQQVGQAAIALKADAFTQGVDAAALAEAAEGLHMLTKAAQSLGFVSSGEAAVDSAPAAAAGSLKRKLDAGDVITAAATAESCHESPAAAPTESQIAEALAAAAGLAGPGDNSNAATVVDQPEAAAAASVGSTHQQQQVVSWPAAADAAALQAAANMPQLQQLVQQQQQHGSSSISVLQQRTYGVHSSSSLQPMPASCDAAGAAPASKRQRLNGVQMAELVASVKHHVQVNPERYTHCVIKDMKEKYPDLDLNMGQIRKIKFRTLGNVNPRPSSKAAAQQQPQPQQQQQPAPAACCASTVAVAVPAAAAATLQPLAQPSEAAAAAAAILPAVDLSSFRLGALNGLPINISAVSAAKLLAAAAASQQAVMGPCGAAAAATVAPAVPGASAETGQQ